MMESIKYHELAVTQAPDPSAESYRVSCLQVVYFFVSLAKGNCSDDVTNFTIAFLAKTLPSVR